MFKGLREQWKQLEDCIIRPPRATYTDDELVGGTSGNFAVGVYPGVREDVELRNGRGQLLKCSYYRPTGRSVPQDLPCVVYCHCNSGSRCDANEVVGLLIPSGIAVMALDFSGSGRSDGEYVSLGVREVDDVGCVVAYLREKKRTSHVAMWGRSMGAVVCLLYGERDPSVAGIVLDSPFSNLVTLMEELATGHQGLRIPKIAIKSLIGFLRRSIKKRANFDIHHSDPLAAAQSSFIPALFGHGKDDDFIDFHHSEALYKAYAGDKNLISFEGGHNCVRPSFFHTSVCIFLANVLGPFAQRSPERSGGHGGHGGPLVSPGLASGAAQGVDSLAASLEGSPFQQMQGLQGHPISPNSLQYTDEMLLQEALALSLMESTR